MSLPVRNLLAFAVLAMCIGGGHGFMRNLTIISTDIYDLTAIEPFLMRSVTRGDPSLCASASLAIEGPLDNSSIGPMLTWGINTVRIILNEFCWLNINGAVYAGATYQNTIKSYVDLLTKNSFAVMFVLGAAGAGPTAAPFQMDPMPNYNHSVPFWRSVATAYKNYTNVLFQLYDRPYPDGGAFNTTAGWSCWRDGNNSCPTDANGFRNTAGFSSIIKNIRTIDTKRIIYVSGISYGNGMAAWNAYKPTDSVHKTLPLVSIDNSMYTPCNNPSCWALTIEYLVDDEDFPLFWSVYDFGEDASDCYCSISCQGAKFGIEAYYMSMSAGYWDADVSCIAGSMLWDWTGTPTPTYGTGIRALYLAEVANGF